MTDSEKFVTIAEFSEVMPARLCSAMLNDNGIPASVFGADSSYPSLGYAKGIQVKVNESDYEEAKKILAAASNAE